jgi:hypothetical protein
MKYFIFNEQISTIYDNIQRRDACHYWLQNILHKHVDVKFYTSWEI